jgi:hypothetical protein
MPAPDTAGIAKTPAEQKIAAYNTKMADLFEERNKHALDSSERRGVAEAILALRVAEG